MPAEPSPRFVLKSLGLSSEGDCPPALEKSFVDIMPITMYHIKATASHPALVAGCGGRTWRGKGACLLHLTLKGIGRGRTSCVGGAGKAEVAEFTGDTWSLRAACLQSLKRNAFCYEFHKYVCARGVCVHASVHVCVHASVLACVRCVGESLCV